MPPWRSDDVAGDGQAEAGAAGAGRAGVVEAGEAVEDPLLVLGRDPGAVVGHGQYGGAAPFDQGQRHGAGGVAGGVVGQVADRPGELVAVAGDLDGGDAGDVDLDAAGGPEAPGDAQDDVVEVDPGPGRRRAGSGVAAGQVEQVLHQVLEPDGLLQDAPVGGGEVGAGRHAPGRPRVRSGCGSGGCAARGRRRPRTAPGGGRRRRRVPAWCSWSGPGGRSRRRRRGRAPGGGGPSRRCRPPRPGSPPPAAACARPATRSSAASSTATTGTATLREVARTAVLSWMSSSTPATWITTGRPSASTRRDSSRNSSSSSS